MPAGELEIEFKPLPGYLTPANRRVAITTGQLTRITATYYEPVTITVSASPAEGGTATGGVFGKGLTATALARPKLGFRFIRWSEQGAEASLAQRYQFTAQTDRTLVAEFLAGPFVALAGKYYAYLTPPGAPADGFIALTVNAAGGFSAQVRFAGKSYRVRGEFDSEGAFAKFIDPRTGLLLELALDLTDGTGTIAGQLKRDAVEVASVAGARSPFSKTRLTDRSGHYTVLFSPAATAPPGVGYGTVDVRPDGTLVFAGTLGDGVKVSQSAAITVLDEWPLFAAPYRGQGALAGTLKFAALPTSDFAGTLVWRKPTGIPGPRYATGFDTTLQGDGARFALDPGQPPLAFTSGILLAGPSGLSAAPAPLAFTASVDGKLSFAARGNSARISRSSGLIRGTYRLGAETRSFGGAVLRKTGRAAGTYLAPAATDAISLETAP